MRTIRLTVAYDGTDYAGWQLQPRRPSIQGELERAVRAVTGSHARVIGAGRTDAGVHAIGQVAHFLTSSDLPGASFVAALNHFLPPQIAVRAAADAADGFHARRDAVARCYRYLVWNRPGRNPLLRDRALFWDGDLDFDRMRAAARHMMGQHDFAALHATGSRPHSTVCEVRRIELRRQGSLVIVDVEADRFLRHMVRIMVGTLLEVGSGKRPPDSIPDLLGSGDSQRAGPVVAACGLYLMRVAYPEDRRPPHG
ncbi:MAG: tRNA pseudouridine(38-40) synthase TruA [Armatimonadota bacterium]|nr:tRNA pseudouridine(38-40) synthase TruA [Armatimonadota bacterium]MDR5697094.1 tRNA pseudouridine(38-40) synthase TruA [Armatimonadota bacterium]